MHQNNIISLLLDLNLLNSLFHISLDDKLRAVPAGDPRRTRPRHAQLQTLRHVRQPDRPAAVQQTLHG